VGQKLISLEPELLPPHSALPPPSVLIKKLASSEFIPTQNYYENMLYRNGNMQHMLLTAIVKSSKPFLCASNVYITTNATQLELLNVSELLDAVSWATDVAATLSCLKSPSNLYKDNNRIVGSSNQLDFRFQSSPYHLTNKTDSLLDLFSYYL
jgi:hypothetical protein